MNFLKDAGQEENKAACTGFRVDDTQYESENFILI